jgi:hypothetical protein
LDESKILWPGNATTKPLEITLPRHLKVVAVTDPPFVYSIAISRAANCNSYKRVQIEGVTILGPWYPCVKQENSSYESTFCCAGYAIDLLAALSRMKVQNRRRAFTFDLRLNESYGAVLLGEEEGYYLNGMLGELDVGRADMAIGALSVNAERGRFVDFTGPWLYHGIGVLQKSKPRHSPMESFMQPLKSSLWLALLICVMLIGLIIYVLDLK